MAEVIQGEQSAVVVKPWWGQLKAVYVGALAGLTWWILAMLIQKYIVEPLACTDLASIAACSGAFGLAGSIAAIMVASTALFVLIHLYQPRPIIIAGASLVILWDLAALMNGLSWWQTLIWAVLLYTLSYSLFSLNARIRNIIVATVVCVVLVVGIRLLLSL